MNSFSLMLLIIVTNVTFCLASKYYVSPLGSINNDGLSASKPRSDFQSIVDKTKPGDTVFFMNGTYTNICSTCNAIEIKNSGNANAYIVFMNYAGHNPKIKFNGWQGIAITNGASYIKVTGFEIEGNNKNVTLNQALIQPGSCSNQNNLNIDPKFNGNGIGVRSNITKPSHHIIISKNTIHDCGGGGIGINQSDYVTIEDNIVYNNCLYSIYSTSGIAIYQSWNLDNVTGYKNFIRRNKCFNNRNLVPSSYFGCLIQDGNGIIFDDSRNTQNNSTLGEYKGKTLIENNLVWYNGGSGIHTYLSDNVDIINNTTYLNNQSAGINSGQILSNSSNNINIYNNILYAPLNKLINSSNNNYNLNYYNNLHFNGSTAVLTNSSCINKDPLFIAPGNSLQADFHTTSLSPTINTGNANVYSASDFDLVKRPIGMLPDIGAYEKVLTSLTTTANYYTSEQTDPDPNSHSNSNEASESISLLLAPNPASSRVYINFKLIENQEANLLMCAVNGVIINKINVVGDGHVQTRSFAVDGLEEGQYLIMIETNRYILKKALLISRIY